MKTNPVKPATSTAQKPAALDLSLSPGAADIEPLKLKKILVPVDLSDCTIKTLQYAVSFARQFNARMIFLHVLPVQYATGWELDASGYEPMIEGDLQKEVESKLSQLIRETIPNTLSATVNIRHGAPSIEIMNAAKELAVDLIIMSTHGHTGRVHALIGSVAGDVSRLAPCPVLVVHRGEDGSRPNRANPFKTSQVLPLERLAI